MIKIALFTARSGTARIKKMQRRKSFTAVFKTVCEETGLVYEEVLVYDCSSDLTAEKARARDSYNHHRINETELKNRLQRIVICIKEAMDNISP